MTTHHRAVSIFLLALAGCFGASQATAEDEPKKPADHASIAAYPQAVISVKDAKSQMLFYVESDGRQLVAFDKDGAVAWRVDVMAEGKMEVKQGTPVIRHLLIQDGELFATCGKAYSYKVDVKTGKVQFQGND